MQKIEQEPTDIEKPEKKINFKDVFQYLKDIYDPVLLIKNEKAMESLAGLYVYSISTKKKLDIINLSLEYEFSKIICGILKKSYENLESLLETDGNDQNNDQNKIFAISAMSIGVIRNFTNYSIKFVTDVSQAGALTYLFKYLKNKKLVDGYASNSIKRMSEIIRAAIGALLNMSKSYSSFSEKWKNENAVQVLLDISEKLKDKDDCQLSTYITLANIVDDEEINKLESLRLVIPGIVKIISKIAKTIETKKNLSRMNVNLNENVEKSQSIAKYNIKNVVWHLVELIDALYHMACNDTIKYEIYQENKMNEILRNIIYHGNSTEAEYALKLLWQLCFDDRVADDVNKDGQLMEKIRECSKSVESESLVKNSNGIIWLINKKFSQNQIKTLTDNKHIMISYNRESRDLCLKIKEDLEKHNFKVWIDVESISGSSLESMAMAVENSMCVLICMTEKYKMSSFCRAEAEYTFQLGKPFIPLIMQDNYKPDGWLGLLLGSKIFINFTKYDYLECIRRLKLEIKNYAENGGKMPEILQKPDLINNVETVRVKELNWNESDVEKWLKEKEINTVIVRNVIPCNGRILHQLYSMQCEAPEFFYKSISSNESIPTKDVAIFAFELKKIFQ